ncbi:MAG TPA: tetratricopeptide repeat protein [Candidatus Acidoferrales bacterium]|nr:tetratricopeptide repeat protein [Candidatus Acidoferrales bacterium]
MARLALAYNYKDGQQSEVIQVFRSGLAHLRDGQSFEALSAFRQAAAMEPENPYFLSYYGLALGQSSRNWEEAEALCLAALRKRRQIPQLYLNLAELYRCRGRVADAVETISDGMRYTGRDARLQDAMAYFGCRRPPVLTFLRRNHPLNRYLGIVRHRAAGLFHRRPK